MTRISRQSDAMLVTKEIIKMINSNPELTLATKNLLHQSAQNYQNPQIRCYLKKECSIYQLHHPLYLYTVAKCWNKLLLG